MPCQQHLTALAGTVCFLLAGLVLWTETEWMGASVQQARLPWVPPLKQGSRGPVFSLPVCSTSIFRGGQLLHCAWQGLEGLLGQGAQRNPTAVIGHLAGKTLYAFEGAESG